MKHLGKQGREEFQMDGGDGMEIPHNLDFLLYRTQVKMQSSPELYVYTCGPTLSRDHTGVHLQRTFTSTVRHKRPQSLSWKEAEL